MSTLQKFAEKLGKAIEDVSELNVRTFSGDLNTIINSDGNALNTDTLENLSGLLKDGITSGTLKLEALTIMKVDGDIDQFLASNIQEDMRDIHDIAVNTGKETRESIFDFIKSAL